MADNWTYPKDLLKKIPPQHYMHILNNNTNVIRVEVGPKTLLCNSEEVAVHGPSQMVIIPPRHYVMIEDPVITVTDDEGNVSVVYDDCGQVKLRHGAVEVRLEQAPFPLYPGERLKGQVQELLIVPFNEALKLEAVNDVYETVEGGDKIFRPAGSKWLFYGPNTYIPQEDVRIDCTVKATIIKPSQALKLEAIYDFTDRTGVDRHTGEVWLYQEEGAFIPDVEEKIIERLTALVLTDKRAIHVQALHNFMDGDIERKSGDQWLITKEDVDEYIPPASATIVNTNVNIITLTKRQWCYILDPYDPETRSNEFGAKKFVRGELNFFLHPQEKIGSINEVYVLTADKALLVTALENFVDESRTRRIAGQRWLEYGPKEYWPPVEVNVQREINAFISIEGANLYLFKPDTFLFYAGSIFAVLLLAIYLSW